MLSLVRTLVIILFISLPLSMQAADAYLSAKIINKSSGKEAYYLLQNKIFAEEPTCVNYPAAMLGKAIQPGVEVAFDIKKQCVWLTIGFEAHRVSDGQLIAIVVYSRRDGQAKLEIKADCPEGICTFYDLNPVQNRHNQ